LVGTPPFNVTITISLIHQEIKNLILLKNSTQRNPIDDDDDGKNTYENEYT